MNTTKYVFLDKLTYADVAFEAYGKTLDELFVNAALATSESMVDLSTVQDIEEKKIIIDSKDRDDLLFTFLEHIVGLKDSDTMVFSSFEVTITQNNDTFHLEATCHGDEINPETQRLHNDVKSVTYHEFKIEQTQGGWKATIVLDV